MTLAGGEIRWHSCTDVADSIQRQKLHPVTHIPSPKLAYTTTLAQSLNIHVVGCRRSRDGEADAMGSMLGRNLQRKGGQMARSDSRTPVGSGTKSHGGV